MNTTICVIDSDYGFSSLYLSTLCSRAWREADPILYLLNKVKMKKWVAPFFPG